MNTMPTDNHQHLQQTRPKLVYDLGIKGVNGKYVPPIEQAMSVYTEYVLAKAGLADGRYVSRADMEEAARRIKEADLGYTSRATELNRKRDQLLLYFEGSDSFHAFDSITIRGFNPDVKRLEALLSSTSTDAESWASALQDYYSSTSSQKNAQVQAHPTARNQYV